MNKDLKMSDLGAELEHHGVKGMKWGHRKEKTPDQQRHKLEKKLNRLDGQRIFEGAGMSGWAAGKGKKNPTASAKRTIAARGAVEVAVVLGGAAALVKVGKVHNARGTAITAGILAGAAALTRIDEFGDVRQYEKSVKIHEQLRALDKKKP